jgi:hypothetical protein
MSFRIKNEIKKTDNNIQNIKESQTLDKKHKEIIKNFQYDKDKLSNYDNEIEEINNKVLQMDKYREKFSIEDLKTRALLLDEQEKLEDLKKSLSENFNEMDYYDKIGDLVIQYYELRDDNKPQIKESKNIMEFLSGKKTVKINNADSNKAELFEKYWKRIEGVRINMDDGSKRIKYCEECNIEKILDYGISAYVCQCCGDIEEIILDEDRQIKDYSPYRRINHFREWLNQFQAKQSPEIPENIYKDIIIELNKNRINDFSELNKRKMKLILKKLGYNSYYEHIHYIINKLSNLPPPKITRDMEKIFIKMFTKIETPWELYKQENRKNFLSYSYVLYKFCELLELDHLLDCFTLHKDPNKLMENDDIWKKICNYLNWEFISSFK